MLTRARAMVDGTRGIRECPAAARAKTSDGAKRLRVEAAPVYLRGRVERGVELPEVEVRTEEEKGSRKRGRGSRSEAKRTDQRLRAVVGFVVTELKADLVVELLEAIKPPGGGREVRNPERKVGGGGGLT